MLDGHVHSDGGVIANLLVPLDLASLRALGTRLRGRGINEPVTVRVWTVVNLFTHMAPTVVKPSNRNAISLRTSLILLAAQQQQTLEYLTTLARAVNGDVPEVRLEVRYTAVPDSLATDPAATKLFDKGWMQRLETLGYERARSGSPWDADISRYARP